MNRALVELVVLDDYARPQSACSASCPGAMLGDIACGELQAFQTYTEPCEPVVAISLALGALQSPCERLPTLAEALEQMREAVKSWSTAVVAASLGNAGVSIGLDNVAGSDEQGLSAGGVADALPLYDGGAAVADVTRVCARIIC